MGVFLEVKPGSVKNPPFIIFRWLFYVNVRCLFFSSVGLLAGRPAALGTLKNDEHLMVFTVFPCSAFGAHDAKGTKFRANALENRLKNVTKKPPRGEFKKL